MTEIDKNTNQNHIAKNIPAEVVEKDAVKQTFDDKQNPQPASVNSKTGPSNSRFRKGCLGCGLVFILAIIVIIIALLWWLRSIGPYLQFDDSFSGNVSENGFSNFLQETGIDVKVDNNDLCFECPPLVTSGEKPVKIIISEEDAASWIQSVNASKYGIEDLRVDITESGLSIASMVNYQGQNLPVTATGTISKLTEKSIDISISGVQVGPLPLPADIYVNAEEWLERVANNKLADTPGLTINSLEFNDGEVIFDGTVPEKIEYPDVDRALPD